MRSCKRKYPRVTPGFGYLDPTFVDIFELETENRVCFIFENRDCQRFFGLRFHTFPRYKWDANTLISSKSSIICTEKNGTLHTNLFAFQLFSHSHVVTPNIKRKTNKFLCQVPFFFVSFAGRRLQTKYGTTIPYDMYRIMSYMYIPYDVWYI